MHGPGARPGRSQSCALNVDCYAPGQSLFRAESPSSRRAGTTPSGEALPEYLVRHRDEHGFVSYGLQMRPSHLVNLQVPAFGK